MKTIDLIVPCYNEEEGLEHFVLETNKVIDSMPEYSFRYILVNDGSKDKTCLLYTSPAPQNLRHTNTIDTIIEFYKPVRSLLFLSEF